MLFYRVIIAGLILGLSTAYSSEFITTNAVNQPAEQLLETESWIFANESITMAGGAKDDVFLCAQKDIVLDGSYGNDVWGFAYNEVTVNGTVTDHLRLAAGKAILIEGAVSNGCTLISSTDAVYFGPKSILASGANVYARTTIFKGICEEDLNVSGFSCSIGGHIKGDLNINCHDIVILPGTTIDGDLNYFSTKELFLDSSINLQGKLNRELLNTTGNGKQNMVLTLFFYLAALLSGAILLRMFPASSGSAARLVSGSRWRCMLLGFASFFVIPLILYALSITVVGIPFMLLLGAAYGMLLYVAKLVTAFWIGGMMLRMRVAQSYGQAVAAFAAGLSVLYLVALIPDFASTVWLLSTTMGLGALLSIVFTRQRVLSLPPGSELNVEKSSEK